MSSFIAKLIVGGKEFNLLKCSLSLEQDTARTGKPVNVITGGKVTMQFEASDNTFIWDWACDPVKVYEGKIEFYDSTNDAKVRSSFSFKEAYLVGYAVNFDVIGTGGVVERPMLETITISSREIVLDGGKEHVNKWTA